MPVRTFTGFHYLQLQLRPWLQSPVQELLGAIFQTTTQIATVIASTIIMFSIMCLPPCVMLVVLPG